MLSGHSTVVHEQQDYYFMASECRMVSHKNNVQTESGVLAAPHLTINKLSSIRNYSEVASREACNLDPSASV